MDCINTSKYTIYNDLSGQEAAGGDLCVTALKPDIVKIDTQKKKLMILELTVPLERNIDESHLFKKNKYAHFVKEITTHKVSVTAFEISSRGLVSKRNQGHLHSLHKMCKAGVKINTFMKNVSTLSIYSSYPLWLCRSDPHFVKPSYLKAYFHDKQT